VCLWFASPDVLNDLTVGDRLDLDSVFQEAHK
jgi:hypothetical protein